MSKLCKKSYGLLFAFCLSVMLSPQLFADSVREEAQAESMTLNIQLINCDKAIQGLKLTIENLEKALIDSKNSLQKEIDNLKCLLLISQEELEKQKALYATLSNQLDDLRKYIRGLETERTILLISVGVLGAALLGVSIYAIVK